MKEFGKLSREQLRRAHKDILSLKGLQDELGEAATEKPDRLREIIENCGHWPTYYTFTIPQTVGLFFYHLGLIDFLKGLVTSKDPHESLWAATAENATIDIAFEQIEKEKQFEVLTVSFATWGHIRAMQMYSQPMNVILQRVHDGDESAIFEAIMVDRAAMLAEPIASRIAQAQMVENRSFFDRLAKSITRTKPRRPKPEYDGVRYMIEVIDEAKGLSAFTYEQLAKVLIDDLNLYPSSGADPVSALAKIIQKRDSISRK